MGLLFGSYCVKTRACQVALVIKNLPANAGHERDMVSIPGLGKSPGEGHGNTLQCSCLENSMDRGARWGTVHRAAKELDTTEQVTLSHICKALVKHLPFSNETSLYIL